MFEKNDLKTIEDGSEEATSFPALIEGRHLDGWNTLHWTLGWCLWVGVCFPSGHISTGVGMRSYCQRVDMIGYDFNIIMKSSSHKDMITMMLICATKKVVHIMTYLKCTHHVSS